MNLNIIDFLKANSSVEWKFSFNTKTCKDSWFLLRNDEKFKLRNPNLDIKEEITNALKNGAKGLIISGETPKDLEIPSNIPVINVKSAILAYAEIAKYHRQFLNCKVIVVSGSNGKTTVKDLLHHILKAKFKVKTTYGNDNTIVGVSKTVLNCAEDIEILILEVGIKGFNYLKNMVNLSKAEIGILTNIGVSHLQYLKSRENIAKAKAEIFENPDLFMKVFLPFNEPLLDPYIKAAKNKEFRFFGDFNFIEYNENYIEFNYRNENFKLPASNLSLAYNATAVIDTALSLGLNMATIKERLLSFKVGEKRGKIIKLNSEAYLFNESYNGSPISVNLLAFSLNKFPKKGQKILILGELAELGDSAKPLLEEMSTTIANSVDLIILKNGENQEFLKEELLKKGQRTLLFESTEEIYNYLVKENLLKKDNVIGVKGSAVANMSELTDLLNITSQIIVPPLGG